MTNLSNTTEYSASSVKNTAHTICNVLCLAFSRGLILLALALLTISCKGGKSDTDASLQIDSIASETLNIDSLEQLYASDVTPLAADQLFDDFFFNYAASGKLQKERTCFPLKVITDGREETIEADSWQTDHFYLSDGYCTGVFYNENDVEVVNDTSSLQASVQRIYLQTGKVDNYYFVRLKGAWMLTALTHTTVDKIQNADFLAFYCRFASNGATQYRYLHSPVNTTVPDPDNDFGVLSGTFYPEQWASFKPAMMPENVVYNIVYNSNGLTHTSHTANQATAYFLIRGVANGLSTSMQFIKKASSWQLTNIAN